MFAIYLAALIFGGIFLVFSFFSGGSDHSGDVGHDASLDGGSHHIELEGSGLLAEAAKFFSFRNIIFFLSFFGLTGTVLTWLEMNTIVTLLSSLGMGLFSGAMGYILMKYIRNTESGTSLTLSDMKGRIGRVVLTASKSKRGKVLISTPLGTRELTALVSEISETDEIIRGETVLVIDIANNDAIITKSDL